LKDGEENVSQKFYLDRAKINERVKVVKIEGDKPIKRRIMDMGITKNQIIYIKKIAPLGDPLEIKVRGYELSIRKADAHFIEVERVNTND
jgi:ferrous iron transport protein A